MRRPAKPFAVEVRKSKKSADRDILGRSTAAESASEPPPRQDHQLDIDRVFARFAPSPSPPIADRLTAERAFPEPVAARPPPAAPASRILPDLTIPAKAEEPTPERAKPLRRAVVRTPQPKRAAKPKPGKQPVASNGSRPPPVVTRAESPPAPKPVARIVIRRRLRDEETSGLRPGERWKRRLPRALR